MQQIEFLKFLDGVLGRAAASCLPPPTRRPLADISSLLVIRPGGIGDAVLLAPMIGALREAFPGADIDVLAEKRNADAFDLIPGVRQVFLYDTFHGFRALFQQSYDVVIDTEQWYRLSAVVTRMLRASLKVGFATNERARMFTNSVAYSLERYEPDSFATLLGPLKVEVGQPGSDGGLRVPESARRGARSVLPGCDAKPLLVLFAGASVPEKRWGVDNFRALVQWCCSNDLRVVLVGGSGDADMSARIAAGSEALNIAGRTSLIETAAVLEQAELVVSGDSGVLHIAAGLGRPTVSIFGPSSATKWAPRGSRHVVLNRDQPCSPCSRFGRMPQCRDGVPCLGGIVVEDVCAAISSLLSRRTGIEN